jgi:hypothetical protein
MSLLTLPYQHQHKYFSPVPIIVLLVIVAPFSYFTKEHIWISLSLPTLFFLTILINNLRLYFCNGIIISEKLMTIISRRKVTNELLQYNSIVEIIYSNGTNRRDRSILIRTVHETIYKIPYSDTSINLAELLKFLMAKNIKVKLNMPDKHLQNYLNGKTNKFSKEHRL